jgi:N-acetylmuramic acid 6-phosphate (MurNAc-6-P) etherase
MRIILTTHAKDRMTERAITMADIRAALEDVLMSWSTNKGLCYVGPGTSGQELKVVVKPPGMVGENPKMIVITVAWRDSEETE